MANDVVTGLKFFKNFEDNKLRPYGVGSTEHDDPIATIILYTESKGKNLSTGESNIIDYFKNFSGTVDSLLSGSINSSALGAPEKPNGEIPLLTLTSGNDYYGVFNNFSVTGMTESHDQITKVHMNFSARWNVFFFGNTPNTVQIRGVFLDTQEYPYYQEFMVAYEKYQCGRKCVENMMQTKLMISGQLIDGYLLNVNVTHNSMTPSLKEFSMNILVKGVSWIRINYTHAGGIQEGFNTQDKLVLNGLSNLNRIGYVGGVTEPAKLIRI
jgi:hypothetical protein